MLDRFITQSGDADLAAEWQSILNGQAGIAFVHNPDFASGMYGSVKSGLRQTCADAVFHERPFPRAAAVGEQLVAYIDEIADIFWQTDKAKQMGVYPPA